MKLLHNVDKIVDKCLYLLFFFYIDSIFYNKILYFIYLFTLYKLFPPTYHTLVHIKS